MTFKLFKTYKLRISALVIFNLMFFVGNCLFAEIVFKPSVLVGSGKYGDNSYTEIHLGGTLHFVEVPIALQLHGFRRVFRNVDDFYGLDLDLKLKRQFQISNQYLIGTYLGPGYRFVSNNLDAPTIDFSLVLSKSRSFSLHLGYKIIMLDWASVDLKNDNFIYLGFQL